MAVKREQVVQTAEKYVARGKIEPAIREYRKLLEENPNDINTLNRVGDLYARIQRIDEAVDFFNQIAEQYAGEGFFVKAIAIYKKIIKLDPTRLDVYENLAELYHRQGLVTEARTQYQVLADYYQKHENATSTIAIYQKMAELEPHNPTYHVKLAELYQQQKLIEKAMGEYRVIAELMIEHGHPQEAAQVYERALAIDSTNISFITDAALKLKEAAGSGVAARFLAAAVERNPQAVQVARLVGGPAAFAAGLTGTHAGIAAPAAAPAAPAAAAADAALPAAQAPRSPRAPRAVPPPAAAAPELPAEDESAHWIGGPAQEPSSTAEPPAASFAPSPADLDLDLEMEIELDLGADLLLDDDLQPAAGPAAGAGAPGGHPPMSSGSSGLAVPAGPAGPAAAAPTRRATPDVGEEAVFEIEDAALEAGPDHPALSPSSSDTGRASRPPSTAPAPPSNEAIDDDVFVLDIEDDEEPASLVKPPPDMLQQPRRPSWAQDAPAPQAPLAALSTPAPGRPATAPPPPPPQAEAAQARTAEPAEDGSEAEQSVDFDLLTQLPDLPELPDLSELELLSPVAFDEGPDLERLAPLPDLPPTAAAYPADLPAAPPDLAAGGPAEVPPAAAAAPLLPAVPAAPPTPVASPTSQAAPLAPVPPALQDSQEVPLPVQAPGAPLPGFAVEPSIRIDPELLERTAAELMPQAVERYEDLVSEAEVLAKYGLEEKAIERLRDAVRIKPRHYAAYLLLIQLQLDKGRHTRVMELANQVSQIAHETADRETWPKLRKRLLAAGYRIEGERVAAGPRPVDAPSGAPRPARAAPAGGAAAILPVPPAAVAAALPSGAAAGLASPGLAAEPAAAPPEGAAEPAATASAAPAPGVVGAAAELPPAAAGDLALPPAAAARRRPRRSSETSIQRILDGLIDTQERSPRTPRRGAAPPAAPPLAAAEPPQPQVDHEVAAAATAALLGQPIGLEPDAGEEFIELPPLLPADQADDGLAERDAPAEIFNPLEIGAMVESEDIDWDDDRGPQPGFALGPQADPAPPAAGAAVPPPPPGDAAPRRAVTAGAGARSRPRPLPPPPAAASAGAAALDDTGMSWLDEADAGGDKMAARAASLFDEEEDFFDLAGELEQELSQEAVFQGDDLLVQQEQSLEEIVEGFKRGVAEHLSPTDFDTHFNLGIAYREMGLLDEAIGEFQLSAKDSRYLVSCCSMLGLCFLDKGLPELAIKWYRRGLEAEGIGEEDNLGLLYDLGCAYLASGDSSAAYKTFVDVYGINTNYRDVVARIEELGHPH
jgi:tetratricopeptide (TPR) repeat protein